MFTVRKELNLHILHVIQTNFMLQRAEPDHCSLTGCRDEWMREAAKSNNALCAL